VSPATRAPPPTLTIAAIALATVLAALSALHHGSLAEAQGSTGLELLHAGAAVPPPLVELHASSEPARLELVALGAGEGAGVSVRVVRHSHWGAAVAPDAPTLVVHGNGEATLTLDRSSPGELVIEAAASGAPGALGEVSALYVVRVLDALPAPGAPDRIAPSRIVGGVDPDDPALPRIRAQARLPLCADARDARGGVGMMSALAAASGSEWRWSPTLSGVPPIEGVASQVAEVRNPASETTSDHPSWWGCYTAALFGTQVPQWIYLCDVPGNDRTRYYAMEAGGPGGSLSAASWTINPHNGELTQFSNYEPLPQAAAPGPHWFRAHSDHAPGYPPPGFDPYSPTPPDAHDPPTDLFLGAPGTPHLMRVHVKGTLSFVPEFLPLDGKVVLRATAFHSDSVAFSTEQPPGSPLAFPGRPAAVNGTLVPTRPVPEPHHHHPNGRDQYLEDGTRRPHHGKAHELESVAADLGARQGTREPHWHAPPRVAASVRVSDIALRNGVLIEGITDGAAGLPRELQLELLRDRGVPDDLDVGAMEVRGLHEVTLVAELPVDVPDKDAYAAIDPALAIEPWGCWPRLNHPASCPEVEPGAGCPTGPSGAAWVP